MTYMQDFGNIYKSDRMISLEGHLENPLASQTDFPVNIRFTQTDKHTYVHSSTCTDKECYTRHADQKKKKLYIHSITHAIHYTNERRRRDVEARGGRSQGRSRDATGELGT